MLYEIWIRHHLRPGEFWSLPRGEQQFILACTEKELEIQRKREVKKYRGA